MKITQKDVQHVAALAHLELTYNELKTMTKQLDSFLSYVDKISTLDTKGVSPTISFYSTGNAFRSDTVRPSLSQKEALANSSQSNEQSFIVPQII